MNDTPIVTEAIHEEKLYDNLDYHEKVLFMYISEDDSEIVLKLLFCVFCFLAYFYTVVVTLLHRFWPFIFLVLLFSQLPFDRTTNACKIAKMFRKLVDFF